MIFSKPVVVLPSVLERATIVTEYDAASVSPCTVVFVSLGPASTTAAIPSCCGLKKYAVKPVIMSTLFDGIVHDTSTLLGPVCKICRLDGGSGAGGFGVKPNR